MFKKEKSGEFVFIIASLFIFGIAAITFFVIKTNLFNQYSEKIFSGPNHRTVDRFDFSDPYITKVKKNVLSGPRINSFDPVMGPSDAKVTIVQFSDYECQYCQEQKELISAVLKKYENQVRYIRKDYPESNVKSRSFLASLAGRCALKQGKFWEFNDILYKNSKQLSANKDYYVSLAENNGLNSSLFSGCMSDSDTVGLINDNISEARDLEINGIPFLFINKQEVIGQISATELGHLIDLELNRS